MWTPLYATVAYAAGHALGTASDRRARTRIITSLTARTDTAAARTLWPYAGWCAFATVLNASLARQNSTR
ncbi:tryptophan-rich sensory protein [Streptomyces sp. Act143]|uniref:tryptophan-rich sensory protein n=1 Tax=Streptomyces sp. Act143 TaxID=2200760 RepID=UPI00215AF496|nr:tryptophan-rich sensory protein [Streptomyces sp. Act143]